MVSKKELMDKAKVIKKKCVCNKPISKYNKAQLEQYINNKEIELKKKRQPNKLVANKLTKTKSKLIGIKRTARKNINLPATKQEPKKEPKEEIVFKYIRDFNKSYTLVNLRRQMKDQASYKKILLKYMDDDERIGKIFKNKNMNEFTKSLSATQRKEFTNFNKNRKLIVSRAKAINKELSKKKMVKDGDDYSKYGGSGKVKSKQYTFNQKKEYESGSKTDTRGKQPKFKNKPGRDEFYKSVNNLLNRESTRARNQVKKFDLTDSEVRDLIDAKKSSDFYTTPKECIRIEQIETVIKKSKYILEPAGGIGHIVNEIMDINPKIKIDINELNDNNYNILKKIYPNKSITNNDFLKLGFKKYDAIFTNPPFNAPKNKDIYLDFLFKSLKTLNQNKTTNYKNLIIICPLIANGEDNFSFSDVYRNMTGSKQKQISRDYTLKELEFTNGSLLMECKGFGGTKITAGVYLISI